MEVELLERSDRSEVTESSACRCLKPPLCHPQEKVIVTRRWRHLSKFYLQSLAQKSKVAAWLNDVLNVLEDMFYLEGESGVYSCTRYNG